MMHRMIVLTIYCCIFSLLCISKTSAQKCEADKQKKWSYQLGFDNGPTNWGKKYSTCKGKSQSPIDINSNNLTDSKMNQQLNLKGYATSVKKMQIENNGHTIVITPQDDKQRSLKLDNVTYMLDSFHFHWGSSSSNGSEHAINGQKYEMEGHFVHKSKEGKLAVVGVFFKANGNKDNVAITNILRNMNSYKYQGDKFSGDAKGYNINFGNLINNRAFYYRYDGSLTTPPCTEGVKWLVCKKPKSVTKNQMKKFYSFYSVKKGTDNINNCRLINNYRPLQPLNGRKVYK